MSTTFSPPTRPFIKARYHGGPQTPKAIVIHGTVSGDIAGTARNIAEWWASSRSPITSAHYTVDPAEDIQSVGDHTVAYHCGYNTGSIGIELCDEETGPASRWQDKNSQAIIKRAAHLTAELCLAYGIEARRPTIDELKRKGPHGIYGHNDSRLAFGGTTHSDPRDFPWAQFLNLVTAEIAKIKAQAAGLSTPATATVKKSGVNRLMTQNVCQLPAMTQDKVTHDVDQTAAEAGVIGWQEIGLQRYKDAIAALDPEVWETYFARPDDRYYDSPISWRKGSWTLIDKGSWKLHSGVRGICGDRYITWVLLRSRSTGALVMFNNGHYVPNGWPSAAERDDTTAERHAMWLDGQKRHRAWILSYMDSIPSAAIVGLGDMNRHVDMGPVIGKKLHGRTVKTLAGQQSIDHIWICNSKDGSVRFDVKGFERMSGRFSDHQGRRARVIITHKV